MAFLDVDELLAAPSSVGVHSTIAMTSNSGSPVLPATPANANSPGLESKSIFGSTNGKGKMNYKHLAWLLFIVLTFFFAYNYFSTGAVGA
jgi:hypothetical protein